MESKRESWIVYRSFIEAGKFLTDEQRGKYYTLIFDHMFDFTVGCSDDNIVNAMFMLVSPQIEANIRKYENWNKAKGSKWESKTEAKQKQNGSKTEGNVNDNVNDNVNVNDDDKKNVVFKKPTIEEVEQYCKDRSNKVDPIRFVNFYESKGRKVGNQRMKDRQACVRTREQKDKQPEPQTQEDYIKVFKEIWLVQFRKKYWQDKANEIMQIAI